ncbi:hypothetical protein PM082_009960 [Marasmius tenuissimus]|nr:hypothetical protein PM082_009960 [Marasmius tenuissimus]
MESMGITTQQFDALQAWYDTEKKGKPTRTSKGKATSDEHNEDLDEDEMLGSHVFEDSENEREKESHDKDKTAIESRQNTPLESADTAITTLSQSDDVFVDQLTYPPSGEDSPSRQPSSALTAYPPLLANTAIPPEFSPVLAVELRQLKRNIQEVTTDLRFRRATPYDTTDLYDQTALQLANIMSQFGVEE